MKVALLGALAATVALPQAQTQRRSPRETVEATIAGAKLSVTYGRPYARGRQIMGGLVPYGQRWRTGADEATSFETSRNLEIGNTIIPAGEYTLFTIPEPTDWTLIFNTQTGQWGTVYDDANDMGRVLMAVEQTAPVEQFTIAFEEIDSTSGALVLAWETTRASVTFIVR